MGHLLPNYLAYCAKLARIFWDDLQLFQGESPSSELDGYLYDWSIVLGVLALDAFESIATLLDDSKVRAAYMLTRAVAEYDVRLRYYVVQSKELRDAHRAKPQVDIDYLKGQMRAARDWENAPVKLANRLSLYDASILSSEARVEIEQVLRSGQNITVTPFIEMLDFLLEHESKILGVLPMFREDLAFRYRNMRPEWYLTSALLHGDQVIITDVLEFDSGIKTGTIFRRAAEGRARTILFTAIDHMCRFLRTFGMIRTWVPYEESLRDEAGELYRATA